MTVIRFVVHRVSAKGIDIGKNYFLFVTEFNYMIPVTTLTVNIYQNNLDVIIDGKIESFCLLCSHFFVSMPKELVTIDLDLTNQKVAK